MTEIVKGLFGFSPQELAMQRDQELTTKANAFAQLSPEQRATQMLYRGGNQLAGAVGGMLGAQDPQMKKSSDLQGIMQSGDFNTVEGATAMAKQAAAMGYGNEAQQMYAHAQGLEKSSAELAYKKAQTTKNLQPADTSTTEMKNAAALAASQGAVRGSPEWALAYKTELARLTAGTTGASIKEVGVAATTRQPVYFDTTTKTQFVMGVDPTTGKQVPIPFNGGVDKTTSKTNVNVKGDAQETEFEKQLGKGQATAILDSKVGAQDASTILQTNSVAKGLLKAGAITGTGADFLIGLNNALLQAGIETTSSDAAANSQAYVANMGANVGRIIKQFGAGTGLSDGDRKYAADIAAGRITLTQKAMERIIDINDRAATNVIKRHNKSVEGIKTNIPLTVEIPTTPLADKKARLAELEAKAKAGGGR